MIAPVDKKIFTVSRLNQEVQRLLETGFGTLWLQGELSNFSRPASGHFYFSLKDSQSQIRCAMFKGRNRYVDFEPGSGDAVIVRGKLGLYSARGDFQLIVEHMEPAGAGKLQAAFEATKRELDAKGWFDAAAKRPLPPLPQTIGVVTSPTSAALRDVLQVLNRRYRQSRVIIYPTLTQGSAAAPAIANALKQANLRQEADVILLVRGGGSLEDLWAFNEISVAEAIRNSTIPIVAGIGHEVDVTISDLVSDLRAPTPSAAAELATPDNANLAKTVNALHLSLLRTYKTQLRSLEKTLEQQSKRLHLRHPKLKLQEQSQRTDELEMRLARAWQASLVQKGSRLTKADTRLSAYSPTIQVAQHQSHTRTLNSRLIIAIANRQKQAKSRFDILARTLHGVSPLAVLDRGYAIVRKNNKPITSVDNIATGDEVTARLSNGEFQAVVSHVTPHV
ncbi:MAG: exodeoxyribonuclease VII large subunit [Granulosicoccus sp.]|jgi:exodeoxyribonuclease VII large subunit